MASFSESAARPPEDDEADEDDEEAGKLHLGGLQCGICVSLVCNWLIREFPSY